MLQSKISNIRNNVNKTLLILVVLFYAFSLPAYGMSQRKKSKNTTVKNNVFQKKNEDDTVPPQIIEVTPKTNATFYENNTVMISPIVCDTGSSPLEYQFSIDGIIKQSWSSLSIYNWVAVAGEHRIRIEARNKGGSSTKEIEVYAYRYSLKKP